MAYTYKSEGIVLKRWPYKERDKMVRILTRDFGKLTTRAISARKLTSKLAGHLEPFVHADFFFARSRTIDIVAGSSTISAHRELRESLEHNAIAGLFSEIVDKSTHDHDVDPELYDHVMLFFHWLDSNRPHWLALYAAALQLFSILGYKIELYDCHNCKQPVTEEGSKFHYGLWNVECGNCSSVEHTAPLTAASIKALRFLNEQPFSSAVRLEVQENEWKDIHSLMQSIFRYHFEMPLASPAVVFSFMQ